MSNPYLDAVLSICGEKQSQMFERFVTTLVLHQAQWRSGFIERTTDRFGLFDITVRQTNEGPVLAQIECKAYDRARIDSPKALKALLKSLDPDRLRARVKKLSNSGTPAQRIIIALPIQIRKENWRKALKACGLPQTWELWDASELANMLRHSPATACTLPYELPNKKAIFDECLVEIIAQRDSHGSMPVSQILEEPDRHVLANWESHQQVLVSGSPHVGKTCWALRQAVKWLAETPDHSPTAPPTAALINLSRHSAEDIQDLLQFTDPEAPLLLVLDDTHYLNSEELTHWVQGALQGIDSSRRRTKTIWLSRDASTLASIQSALNTASLSSSGVEHLPFPLESIIDLYLEGVQDKKGDGSTLGAWQRHLVALEAGLDPRIAFNLHEIVGKAPTEASTAAFTRITSKIHAYRRDKVREGLAQTENAVGSRSSYEAYLRLLPFAAINYPVRIRDLWSLGVKSIADIERLVRAGWASYLATDQVVLTVHPFHAQLALNNLTFLPDRYLIQKGEERSASIHEIVFTKYFTLMCHQGRFREECHNLFQHAYWAGVRAPLAEGLSYFLERDDVGSYLSESDTRASKDQAQKLRRTSYPYDEMQFRTDLDSVRRGLREDLSKKKDGLRADSALYEISYTYLLTGRFGDCLRSAQASEKASFEAIAAGLSGEKKTRARLEGAMALANIWVARMVSIQAKWLGMLWDALSSDSPDAEALLKEAVNDSEACIHLHEKLLRLNELSSNRRQAQDNRWWSIACEALSMLDPAWREPANAEPYGPEEMSSIAPKIDLLGHLRRHEYNVWYRAHAVASYPALYGFSQRPELPRMKTPAHGYQPALWNPEGITPSGSSTSKYLDALRAWAEAPDEKQHRSRLAFEATVLLRGSEKFEGLGEKVLLAYHSADSEEVKKYLAWYMNNRVPSIGHNEVAMAAMSRLRQP